MTTSLLDAPPVEPRVSCVPPYLSSAGRDATDLAASAGLILDPWQSWALDRALGERADGKWAAFEVALVLARQNGKGAILEARELAGLYLFDNEQLILHSAHEFKTAQEAFRRVLQLVETLDGQFPKGHPLKVKRVRTSHGEEGIELNDGTRLRFVARSTGSGRGFTGDCIILDEAYQLGPEAMAALLPTLSARPNPQLWYASSAGTDSSEQLAAVRERGKASAAGLCYLEWSAEENADLDDREAWHQANPAMPHRILPEFVERERDALPEIEFARERLGIWEPTGGRSVIDADVWHDLTDRRSQPGKTVAFAVDVPPEQDAATITVAGHNPEGLVHVEIVAAESGTKWVPERLAELVAKWKPCATMLDPSSPAGALLENIRAAGVEPETVSGREMAQACGAFYSLVYDGGLAHIGQPKLNVAVDAGRKRTVSDAWAWHRRDTASDISPLVAVTLAAHGLGKHGRNVVKRRTGAYGF